MPSVKALLLPALLVAGQCTLARAEDDPTFSNTVYLIRNAETNTKVLGSGLSPAGQQRAQCLPSVFGPGSQMQVGYIIAEPPTKTGNKTEAVDTATPLAQSLGLTLDTSCDRTDKDCVGDALSAFAAANPSTSMLVVWDTETLPDIAEALGANDVPDYPSKRWDLIWTIQQNVIQAQTSEDCPGLDVPIALARVAR
ncbi:hypothetical protein PHLGIDRAFT_76998 [Phlebiopsis gigantea 11061_1 CR5-6]|uniref:Phosphoglycerate mutase family protein n=1 Tax=Phlebiopsis gigantea (strain 11061_1 CR5-6) TaxID=745531 RepID=A0A0C3NGF8_PHLG1|nr:hypothetical protein PHLGIDRAFT_76998 [Phlebiopsis gigantea 11061_1 CR5-6]